MRVRAARIGRAFQVGTSSLHPVAGVERATAPDSRKVFTAEKSARGPEEATPSCPTHRHHDEIDAQPRNPDL